MAATLVLGLGGCTGKATSDGSATSGTATASGDASPVGALDALGDTSGNPRYSAFYDQKPQWKRCGGLTCTTIKVPLDWTIPEKGSISLAVNRRKAGSSDRLGAILYNPGGPGGSGVDVVKQVSTISDKVAKRYDLVGFDPRGVGKSNPVDCVSDKALDTFLSSDLDPSTPEGRKAVAEADKTFGAGCAAKTGALIRHVDTWSASRDMDVIRASLAEQKLNYLGASYGTLLGAEYAGFYPDRVGRFVLDGALDPSTSNAELSRVQAIGFENALRSYMKACLAGDTGDCPFRGTVDSGMAEIKKLLTRVDQKPVKVGKRELTAPLAVSGIVYPLYDESQWFILSQGLQQLKQGDGQSLLYLADEYNDRQDDGSFADKGNGTESFYAINCLDYPTTATTPEQMKAQAVEVEKVAPTLGKWFSYSDLFCDNYPVKAVRTPHRITAEGSGPIVVVGTTRDPATPYRWSKALASQLSDATLLTFDGDGHTAYLRESDCIDKYVDAYFLDGKVPPKDTVCTS